MRNLLKITVLLLTASVALAQNPKLGHDLDGIDPKSNVNVIIQYNHVPTQDDHQRVRGQGGVLKKAVWKGQGRVLHGARQRVDTTRQ